MRFPVSIRKQFSLRSTSKVGTNKVIDEMPNGLVKTRSVQQTSCQQILYSNCLSRSGKLTYHLFILSRINTRKNINDWFSTDISFVTSSPESKTVHFLFVGWTKDSVKATVTMNVVQIYTASICQTRIDAREVVLKTYLNQPPL